MSEKTIYSVHHFMFPFRWDYIDEKNKNKKISDIPFEERTSLKNVTALIENDSKWKRKEVLTNEDYNHYTYFHSFVRNTLYDYKNNENNDIVRYFEYDYVKNAQYTITYDEGESNVYKLDVAGITLHIFQTGVSILSFDLKNTLSTQSTPEDILKINELGRRIYPQFLNFDEKNCIDNVQRAFLAKSIGITGVGEDKEEFKYYSDLQKDKELERPFTPPSFIKELFPNNIFVNHSKNDLDYSYLRVKKLTDDRMFFLSWYGNDNFCKLIAEDYTNNDWWYAYIFGDKSLKSIANQTMQEEQLDVHSYQRWSGYGTLYGMSRDSFVCISSTEETLKKNNAPNLRIHQSTIYYQIAILCLLQRATVLKFSAEVANLASVAKHKNKRDKKLKEKIQTLYAHYIEFRNKIYFREITSQIQGIEIYQKFQGILNLKNEVADLDAEIEELNRFANMIEQEKQSRTLGVLQWISILLLPPTLVAGILGMNIYGSPDEIPRLFFNGEIVWAYIIPTVALFLLTFLVYSIYQFCNKR